MAEIRLDVVLEAERSGQTVAQVCRRHGISRDTYYRYRRRYLEEGLEGLEDRSRRPIRSPAQIDPDVEVEICRMRGDHPAGEPGGSAPSSSGRSRPPGGLHRPPGPPAQPPGGGPAAPPAEGPEALRAGGLQHRLLDLPDEVDSGPDLVDVDEDPVGPEPSAEPVEQPPRVSRGVIAAVTDEDVGPPRRPPHGPNHKPRSLERQEGPLARNLFRVRPKP